MYRLKKYAPLIAILSVVFWYNAAFAAETVFDSTSGNASCTMRDATIAENFLVSTSTILTNAHLFIANEDAGPITVQGTLYNENATSTILATSTQTVAVNAVATYYDFPFSYQLIQGETYILGFNSTSSAWAEVKINTNDVATSGHSAVYNTDQSSGLTPYTGGFTCAGGGFGADLNLSLTGNASSSLTWRYPTNGITTIDFPSWFLTAINTSSSYSRLIIDYGGPSSSSIFLHDTFNNVPSSLTSIEAGKGYILPLGTTWATAKLADQTTGHTIADAGLISFEIVSPTSTVFTTSSVSCAAPSSTLDIGGYLAFAICGMFAPSQASQTALANLGTELRLKPPWGYIVVATDAIANISSSSAASSSVAVIVSTFSGLFSPIRTVLAGVLWFVFAFWVVHRMKDVHT